ncbi:MAG: DUF1538 domain-containing protein [Clostridia bacterium]|nr:DUF1538 domain-containing protein [Clostridia bacterium]
MIGKKFGEKLRDSLKAVLPIIALVLLLSLTVAPMPAGTLLTFLFGGLLLIVGMMLFSLGAEVSMEPMGNVVGSGITKTKNLKLILILGFFLGVMITMSEPDLQVLANQIQSIPNMVLIISVAVGVGLFLVTALLRMLFRIPLRRLLWLFYGVVFILAVFAPESFLAVAFDSGGVTTGPMTVPFIMAFGIGIASIRSDEGAADDSFGLISLCSVGPIIAVMVLSMIFRADGAEYARTEIPNVSMSVELTDLFAVRLPDYLKEIGIALLPIIVFFFVFEAICVKLSYRTLSRIGLGLIYTYAGLTLFLTGANVGFMPAGAYLGSALALTEYKWIVIPIGMVIGFFIVKAEPAVYVLMRQVEELTDGEISGRSLQMSLCIGVSASVGLAMLRVLTGISILWMMVPGYAIALAMTFVTPKIFTAIAFDSGGVASGPMTATFLLPFACGACIALGGNVVTDAFGVVAMVAMTPLITIQILGIVYNIRTRVHRKTAPVTAGDLFADMPDNMIIDL